MLSFKTYVGVLIFKIAVDPEFGSEAQSADSLLLIPSQCLSILRSGPFEGTGSEILAIQ